MCAMIPMLRVRDSGNSRIASPRLAPWVFRWSITVFVMALGRASSPAVVGEGLVGLGHLVGVFLALDRGAGAVGGVQQLAREAVGHGLLPADAGGGHHSPQRQGGGAALAHLD